MTLADLAWVASKLGAYDTAVGIIGSVDCELAILVDREDLERIKDEAQRYSQYSDDGVRMDGLRVCGILVLPRPRT